MFCPVPTPKKPILYARVYRHGGSDWWGLEEDKISIGSWLHLCGHLPGHVGLDLSFLNGKGTGVRNISEQL